MPTMAGAAVAAQMACRTSIYILVQLRYIILHYMSMDLTDYQETLQKQDHIDHQAMDEAENQMSRNSLLVSQRCA